jgi:hypothetical protein
MTLGEHRCRAEVRTAPLVRARGTLERHEGTTSVVVTEVVELISREKRLGVDI